MMATEAPRQYNTTPLADRETTWESLASLFGALSSGDEVRICATTRYKSTHGSEPEHHRVPNRIEVMFVGPQQARHLPVADMLNELAQEYPTATISIPESGEYGIIDVSESEKNGSNSSADTSARSYFCIIPESEQFDELDRVICAAMPVEPESIRSQAPFAYQLYSNLDLF